MKLIRLLALALLAAPSQAQGWVERTQLARPAARMGHGMCWDPIRNYVLMAGGTTATGSSTNLPAADTWSWDGVTWTNRGTAPFAFATLVAHEATQRVLAIGNNPGSGACGCFEWNGTAWQPIPFIPNVIVGATGNGYVPFRYISPPASYDPIRQELVAFVSSTEVAVFDGTTWSSRTTSTVMSPITSAAYDPVAARIVATTDELQYVLIGSTWVVMAITRWYEWNGVGLTFRYASSSPSVSGTSVTDTIRQRLIHFDGDSPSAQVPGASIPDHTWLVSNGTYTRLATPVTPTPRVGSAMAFDPVRGRVVLFGGSTTIATNASAPNSDTWEFYLGPLATFTGYGTGCPASRGVPRLFAQPNSAPRVRNPFGILVDNLPWSAPTFLLFGLSNTNSYGLPLPFDLGVAGAPGCTLLTSIDNIIPLNNVLGSAAWSIDLPYLPGASFYVQAVPFEPSANALGVALSNGGHGLLGL